jgi:acyl-coenzyme A synthetase/AMP-(fatty) acid ligase
VALYWEGVDGSSSVHTFAEFRDGAARFANVLEAHGIGPGDRVAVMLPRIPELMVVALGVWRAGAVYAPMFTAFGPKAIEYRLERSEAKLVITDLANRSKFVGISNQPPIMVVTRGVGAETQSGDFDFNDELDAQDPVFEPVLRGPDDPFLLMFTSGTVGSPKGVVVPHKALPSFIAYMKYAVDLRPHDRCREVGPGTPGRLAIDTRSSPLYWFLGYEGKGSPLEGPYYITGDMAEIDEDGCITFSGRDDDIILSAGYRIGPFDVESCLIEHPAVTESGVVGKLDAERGEVVVAFVVLHPDHPASSDLARELQTHTRERLSAHAYPREVIFVDALPKTPSGKIQRFVLRKQTKTHS